LWHVVIHISNTAYFYFGFQKISFNSLLKFALLTILETNIFSSHSHLLVSFGKSSFWLFLAVWLGQGKERAICRRKQEALAMANLSCSRYKIWQLKAFSRWQYKRRWFGPSRVCHVTTNCLHLLNAVTNAEARSPSERLRLTLILLARHWSGAGTSISTQSPVPKRGCLKATHGEVASCCARVHLHIIGYV